MEPKTFRENPVNDRFVILLVSSAIVLEALLLVLWLGNKTSYFVLFLIHLSAVLFLAKYVRLLNAQKKGSLRAVRLYCLALVLFFPVAGLIAAFSVLLIVIRLGGKFKSGLYDEYEEYITHKEEEVSGRGGYASLLRRVRSQVSFDSFIDIMRWGTTEMKSKVIRKLSDNISSDSVKILKDTLSDPSPEVRFYVAGALLKVEATLNGRIELVSRTAKRRNAASDFAHLGDLYRVYSQIGIAEEALSNYYLRMACDAYQNCLDIESDQPGVIVNYTRCLMGLKRYDHAKKLLDRAVRLWPRHEEMVFLRGEVYFQLGDFGSIAASLGDVKPDELSAQRHEVLEFWKSAR